MLVLDLQLSKKHREATQQLFQGESMHKYSTTLAVGALTVLLGSTSAHASTKNDNRWVEIGVTPDRTAFEVDATSIRVNGKHVIF